MSEDSDELAALDQSAIIPGGRRTRGIRTQYTFTGNEKDDSDDDNDDSDD